MGAGLVRGTCTALSCGPGADAAGSAGPIHWNTPARHATGTSTFISFIEHPGGGRRRLRPQSKVFWEAHQSEVNELGSQALFWTAVLFVPSSFTRVVRCNAAT